MRGRGSRPVPRGVGLVAAVLAAALLGSCAGAQRPQGRPSSRPGWLVYELRDLRFEAPAGWRASGDLLRVTLEHADGLARLEVTVPERDFADERRCLAAAEERLGAAAGGLERARRHPSRLAGRPAQSLEADRAGWHVWALAACDGGVQYRVFLTAATPAPPEALEVWRTLLQSARLGGEV